MNLNQEDIFRANESTYLEEIKDRTLDDLLNEIESFFKKQWIENYEEQKELIDWIKGAFFIAQRAHYWQYRDSWEEYIQHPLRVAIQIVKEYWSKIPTKLFFETIKVALLHDVKEDGWVKDETLNDNCWKVVEKSVSLLTKEPWQNFLIDKDCIKNNPIEAKRLWKIARDKQYFGKLTLLKERKYEELNMQDFSTEEQENIRIIVLAVKWFDRIDNHKTHGKQSKEKVWDKVLETKWEIINLLDEHPQIVKKLREVIWSLVSKRLESNKSFLI